jgi:hypothetical protein
MNQITYRVPCDHCQGGGCGKCEDGYVEIGFPFDRTPSCLAMRHPWPRVGAWILFIMALGFLFLLIRGF